MKKVNNPSQLIIGGSQSVQSGLKASASDSIGILVPS